MAVKASFGYDSVPELSPRVLQKLVREALTLALQDWRKKIEPKHFTNAASAAYKYKRRDKGYQIKKARRTGQTAPLVFTGNSKRMALASDKITTRGTQATLSITVPDYWDIKVRDHPDMRDELTRVTAAEEVFLAAQMDKHLQRLIDVRLNK